MPALGPAVESRGTAGDAALRHNKQFDIQASGENITPGAAKRTYRLVCPDRRQLRPSAPHVITEHEAGRHCHRSRSGRQSSHTVARSRFWRKKASRQASFPELTANAAPSQPLFAVAHKSAKDYIATEYSMTDRVARLTSGLYDLLCHGRKEKFTAHTHSRTEGLAILEANFAPTNEGKV